MEKITIKIKDILTTPIAVAAEDGRLINLEVRKYLEKKQTVILDFDGIELLNTAFLNTAIGELYKDFSAEELNMYLKLSMQKDDFETLKLVIQRAKEFYKDSQSFNNSADNAFKNG